MGLPREPDAAPGPSTRAQPSPARAQSARCWDLDMYLNYLAQNVSPSAQTFALLGKHQVARFVQNEKELLLLGRRGKEERSR